MEKHPWRNPEIYFFVLDFLGLINLWHEYLVGLYLIHSEADTKSLWKKSKVTKGSLIFYNLDIRILTTSENLDHFLWHTCTHPKKSPSYYIYTGFYIACFYLKCSCNQIHILHHITTSKLSYNVGKIPRLPLIITNQ